MGKRAFYKKNKHLAKVASALKYRLKKSELDKKLDPMLGRWLEENQLSDKNFVSSIKKDMLFSEMYYRIDLEEYLRYGFLKLSDAGRREYIGEKERYPRMYARVDKPSFEILNKKIKAWETFRKYYGRDMIEVEGENDLQKFRSFCSGKDEVIVKPYNATGGHGIYKVKLRETTADEAYKRILKEGKSVVEDVLIQDPGMARFHPASINTIRLVTYNRDGKIKIAQTSIRIGVGDSVVDNGCLSASVDTATGIIITRGRYAHKKGLCIIHPDTGVPIVGAQIPKWDELLALAQELPKVLPNQRIIGWDLCLTPDGWKMIEGNSCPMIQILAGEGIGMRKVFEEITRP